MIRSICLNCQEAVVIPQGTHNWQHESTGLTRCPGAETFAKETKGAETKVTPKKQPSPDVDPSAVREWARANGYEVGDRGRIKKEIVKAFLEATDS